MKITKLLVPLDGSFRAEVALQEAVELLRQHVGARLVLVRAVDPASLPRLGATGPQVAASQMAAINEAAEYLRGVAAKLRNQGVGLVARSVWYDAAGPAIVEVARVTKPDLIVMAAHGRSRGGRLTPGLIAESVRRGTRVPIVLVAAEDTPTENAAGRAMVRETEMVHA